MVLSIIIFITFIDRLKNEKKALASVQKPEPVSGDAVCAKQNCDKEHFKTSLCKNHYYGNLRNILAK
jgi:hypothetical protein